MGARDVAEGFVRIAVDNMANAIKQISIARGHDVTRYTLQCFGGAGGQHACLVADALGIGRVMIHPLAGVLSAYGMGLADMVELRQRTLAGADLEAVLAELEAEAVAALRGQGVEAPEIRRRAALRYDGSDSSLEVTVSDRYARGFRSGAQAALRLRRARGRGRGRDGDRRGDREGREGPPRKPASLERQAIGRGRQLLGPREDLYDRDRPLPGARRSPAPH